MTNYYNIHICFKFEITENFFYYSGCSRNLLIAVPLRLLMNINFDFIKATKIVITIYDFCIHLHKETLCPEFQFISDANPIK